MAVEVKTWKDVIGYEGIYQISNDGEVKSLERSYKNVPLNKDIILPERIMKTNLICGYPMLGLTKNGVQKLFSIHRLLGVHFIPNPHNYKCINHKNSIRSDYRLENLEWCSYSQNTLHLFRVKGYLQKSGAVDELSKPIIALNINTNDKMYFGSVKEASISLMTYTANINKSMRKKRPHKGYTFEFAKKW